MKKLSIIIPAYKEQDYIKECIKSVKKQKTDIPFEILIGIDACIETYNKVRTDKDIRLFWFDSNVGSYVVRNTLIEKAKGDVICMFDADDIMSDNYINENIALLSKNSFVRAPYKCFQNKDSNEFTEWESLSYSQIFFYKKDFISINGFHNWRCSADHALMERFKIKGLQEVAGKAYVYRRMHKNNITLSETHGIFTRKRKHYKNIIEGLKSAEIDVMETYPAVETKRVKVNVKNEKCIVFGVTTYNRINFLKKTLESFFETKGDYNYKVLVADDGSDDGTLEYLEGLDNVEIIYNYRKHVHYQKNTIIKKALTYNFEYLILADDDVEFKKKGWDELYFNNLDKIGHLCFYDMEWNRKLNKLSKKHKEHYVNNCSYEHVQGAMCFYTKETIEKIGYNNIELFGKIGYGHTDHSIRAYQANGLDWKTIYDIEGSNDYISLIKENYKTSEVKERYEENTQSIILSKIKLLGSTPLYCDFKQGEPSILNNVFDKIYCLNLDREIEYWERCRKEFSKYNINVERISAVDGRECKSVGAANQYQYACFSSHVQMWKNALLCGYEKTLILEDDVYISKNINEYNFDDLPEWDVLFLGASQYGKINKKSVYKTNHETLGTFAIAYKRKALKMLVEAFSEADMAVDVWLAKKIVDLKLKSYCIHPNIIIPDVRCSGIRIDRNQEEHSKEMGWDLNMFDIDLSKPKLERNKVGKNTDKTIKIVMLKTFFMFEQYKQYELKYELAQILIKKNKAKQIN